jgi:hypothetical protein
VIVKRGWNCAGKSRRCGTKNDSWSASGLLSPRANPREACRGDPGDVTRNAPHGGRRIFRSRPEVNRSQPLQKGHCGAFGHPRSAVDHHVFPHSLRRIVTEEGQCHPRSIDHSCLNHLSVACTGATAKATKPMNVATITRISDFHRLEEGTVMSQSRRSRIGFRGGIADE